jgi:RimJ/RimL family protein N-acetyltransferase
MSRLCRDPAFNVEDMDAMQPPHLLVRPMNADDAVRVAGWRYREQWSAYDLASSADLLHQLHLYWAVTDTSGSTIGFFCVGAAARVPGLEADSPFIVVGVGVDPELVGQGMGHAFGDVVVGHVAREHPGRPLRAAVQAWNVRSLRFTARLGFIDVGELVSPLERVSYRVLVKPASISPEGLLVAQSGIWLFGSRLVLREFVAADEEAVHSYAEDPVVTQFTEWGPNSLADTHAFLTNVMAQRSNSERVEFTLAAVHAASGWVIGSGDIRITDVQHRRGEFGYVFNRDFWAQGYATELARLLVGFGFEHLRLRRISATCHPDNVASARVLQNAGLHYEGRMNSHLSARGGSRDSLVYAIVE